MSLYKRYNQSMNTNDFAGLARIKSMSLPESEARVAAVVLKSAKAAAAMTIAQVAQHALVSQPTVARFCQSAGFGGWRDFRLWFCLLYTSDAADDM
jgi:RpiR family carbohydrate utilization transcriptional regulator